MQPFVELLFWSALLAFITALMYRVLTKPQVLRDAKKQTTELKLRMNKAQKAGDTKESSRLMTEMLRAQNTTMRANMKPMFASMLLFIFVLGWLNGQYGGVTAGLINTSADTFAGNFTYSGFTEGFSVPFTVAAPPSNVSAYRVSMDINGAQNTLYSGDEFTYAGSIWKVKFMADKNNTLAAVFFEAFIATPFYIPFVGSAFNWFWWYFVVVIAGNFIFRKLLGVE